MKDRKYEFSLGNPEMMKAMERFLYALHEENNRDFATPGSTKEESTAEGTREDNKILNSEEKHKPIDRVDAVIIVAIPEEKKGVFDAFRVPHEERGTGVWNSEYNFRYHRFDIKEFSLVLLKQTKMGMTAAASLATRAIMAFKPRLIAMAGICGGRKGKTNLGDIIVASTVFDHTAGKHYSERFKFRPDAIPLDDAISDIVSNAAVGDDVLIGNIRRNYGGDCPPGEIKVHLAPIASGTAVIDNPEVVDGITVVQDDMAGIDMEAYGLACAAKVFGTKWIVAKAVQDFADGSKSETEEKVRSFAAFASAELLRLLLEDFMEVV